jgi:antitoxin component YwqK of YwqJK toxin-antitoxin module
VENYYCGLLSGLTQYFDTLGYITRSTFESPGKSTIEERFYYPKGKLKEIHILLDEYKVPIYNWNRDTPIFRVVPLQKVIVYYESGELKTIKTLDAFRLTGKYTEYWQNGLRKIESEYKNGKRNGIFIEYYENGHIKLKTFFKNDIERKRK